MDFLFCLKTRKITDDETTIQRKVKVAHMSTTIEQKVGWKAKVLREREREREN